jgi:hypothetical protein
MEFSVPLGGVSKLSSGARCSQLDGLNSRVTRRVLGSIIFDFGRQFCGRGNYLIARFERTDYYPAFLFVG